MSRELALGLDMGTGGARAVVIDATGNSVASGSAAYPLLKSEPGAAEQAAEDWWAGAQKAIAEALAGVGGSEVLPGEMVGVGLSGQMHGTVLVDDELNPLRNALLWCDSRASAAAAGTVDECGSDWLIGNSGNLPLAGFTGPQLRWMRERGDPALEKARWVLCAKDYIRGALTGVAAAEPSDASGTGMYSLPAGAWDTDLAAIYGIDPQMLPPLLESGSRAGQVTPAASRATGIPAGTPVAAGAADNAAAALGAGIVGEGQLMVSVGTSGTVLAPCGTPVPDPSGRCHLFRHALEGTWYSMAVVLSAGGALSWWREVFGVDFKQLSAEAAVVAPGSEGILVLPYFSGLRMPRNEPLARASVIGLALSHQRGHLTRATMEGAAYALSDGLDCLRQVGVTAVDAVLTGGASEHALWQEILALAMPGLSFSRSLLSEGAALGAALLGFSAAGHPVDEMLDRAVGVIPIDAPNPSPAARRAIEDGYRRFRALSEDPLVVAPTPQLEEIQ